MVCFHYYSFTFYASWGLQFYSQNSWFSDIIFEHRNNFLSNTGRWTGSRDFFRVFRSKKFDSEIVSRVFLKFLSPSIDDTSSDSFFDDLAVFCARSSSATRSLDVVSHHLLQLHSGNLVFNKLFFLSYFFLLRFSRSPMTENEESYFKSPSFVFRGALKVFARHSPRSIHPLFGAKRECL